MATRLIDIHPHIISPDTTRYPVAPLGGEQSGWSAKRPATFEQYDAAMTAAGIDKAAIVHSSTTYGFDNSYVADAVATQPKRFDGVFSVDILAPDAPQKIRHWVDRKHVSLGEVRSSTPQLVDMQTPHVASVTPIDPPIIVAHSFSFRVIRQPVYPSLELRLVLVGSVELETKIMRCVAEL